MVCTKCGAQINDGDNFCEECGASLKKSASNASPSSGGFPKSDIVVYDSNLAAATNIGRRHHDNEDAGTVGKCENGDSVLMVADGVSSSVNPTTGSRKAIEIIKEILIKNDKQPKELMISAIRTANTCIKSLPYETREDGLYGPETTVVAAMVQGNTATIGWVGDSRAYILGNDKQEQLTVDDSWAELVVAEGTMTREEAFRDRRAHCVTQVLGMHDQAATAHILECKLKEGELLLLCSDGLWNYFQSEKTLLRAVMAFGINSEAAHICDHLVGLANAAGGHDNITVAILRN
jgi:PPM family protein phosphatase